MADVSVRPARPEDAERIAAVQLTTWAEAYSSLLPPIDVPLVQVAAVWLNAIEAAPSPQHRVLVAMDRHELVGFAASTPTDEPGTAELTALLVEPRWGRRGHGSRLVAATVEHWRGDGVQVGQHWAFEKDAVVISFLESVGWGFDGLGRALDTGPRLVHQRRMHTLLD
jgi:ribosomal protein S18 acetylase RimI-like enzyme